MEGANMIGRLSSRLRRSCLSVPSMLLCAHRMPQYCRNTEAVMFIVWTYTDLHSMAPGA